MDSLTQIVLGAAIGEAVLGKKVGNKALLWGAVAGTIPDLDVISKVFVDDLTANEWHRGISHSLFFSLVMAPVLAWFIHKKERYFIYLIILALAGFVISMSLTPLVIGAVIAVSALFFWATVRMQLSNTLSTQKDWTKLLFWCLLTHPLLDAHTSWGTQLLWPFPWKYSWNNIFVVDPLYTVPFMLCVIAVLFIKRESSWRNTMNWIGIGLSSVYMLFTLVMKYVVFTHFRNTLRAMGQDYVSMSTRPTPLNSILWTANVNIGDAYLISYYSVFDTQPISWVRIDKNRELLGQYENSPEVERLFHLTAGEYAISYRNDTLVYNDLRFGMFGEPRKDGEFVFAYQLIPQGDGLLVKVIPPPRPGKEEGTRVMVMLWNRMKGN